MENQWKIQLRTISNLVLCTLCSHITLASFKYFMPYKMSFAFVDRMNGVVKYDGLVLLRMMIKISKPDTVTNIRDTELGLDVNDVKKCISHQQQCCITPTHTALDTSPNSDPPLYFDTDGISFIIDSSATSLLDASHLSKYP